MSADVCVLQNETRAHVATHAPLALHIPFRALRATMLWKGLPNVPSVRRDLFAIRHANRSRAQKTMSALRGLLFARSVFAEATVRMKLKIPSLAPWDITVQPVNLFQNLAPLDIFVRQRAFAHRSSALVEHIAPQDRQLRNLVRLDTTVPRDHQTRTRVHRVVIALQLLLELATTRLAHAECIALRCQLSHLSVALASCAFRAPQPKLIAPLVATAL
mmetsp:Transcript_27968/g.58235  ORF Transcript_27968/g.58235 Transcript_27968/m.58235 type:complete len:217 (+) Transcript_27968:480-1130(+)